MVDCMARNKAVTVADRGVFQPIWTERIGGEWRRNAERLLQIPPETLAEQWIALNQHFRSAMETNTVPYEVGLRYSDRKDLHVIAAGLERRARCGLQGPPAVRVMTWNLKDFDRSELWRQGLHAYSPEPIAGRVVAGEIMPPETCRAGHDGPLRLEQIFHAPFCQHAEHTCRPSPRSATREQRQDSVN